MYMYIQQFKQHRKCECMYLCISMGTKKMSNGNIQLGENGNFMTL